MTCSESEILLPSRYPIAWDLAGRNTDPESLQEDYVNHLKEDKLRALGVDEQLPRDSPAMSVMSRQGSSQSSAVPTSPALAPSSHAGPFPTSFYGAVNPTSYIGKPVVSHFPRYSIAHSSNEPSLISSNILPHPSEPRIAGTCSPQTHFASQQGSRVASPSVNGHVQPFEKATPSASPVGMSNVCQISNQVPIDLVARMREHQALLQTQQLQQRQHHYHQQQILQQRLSPSLGIFTNEERILQPVAHQNQAEIVTPIPLDHRKNPSESLQNGVEEAELRSSYSMSENEGREGVKGAGDDENQVKTVLDEFWGAAPQSARADRSVLDASLSVEGTPDHEANIPGQSQKRHPSKNSQLNVNAPKFEPRTLQNSGVFSFLGNQQAQKVIGPEIGSFLGSDGAMQAPNGASQPGKWNVAAPAFMPKVTVPSREFSFSALRPSLRPDAPTFKPSDSGNVPGPESASEHNAAQPVKKIFGDVAFPEVTKPSKSKAIPITKPSEASKGKEQFDGDMDGQEDESGRITQADGRQKRMRYVGLKTPLDILHFSLSVETCLENGVLTSKSSRREREDGDQIPLFAPSGEKSLWTDRGSEDRAAYFSRTPSPESDAVDASTLEAATDLLEGLIENLSATEASDLMREEESVDEDKQKREQHGFNNLGEAASFNAAQPPDPSEVCKIGKQDRLPLFESQKRFQELLTSNNPPRYAIARFCS